MPKVPRISGKDMIRFLKTKGFHQIVRIKGSHYVMKNTAGKFTVVPVHGSETLGIGLIRKILQDADVCIEDFAKYWNG